MNEIDEKRFERIKEIMAHNFRDRTEAFELFDYISCFIFDEDLDLKKFRKYVERTENKIVELFKHVYGGIFERNIEYIPECKTFKDIISRSIYDLYIVENGECECDKTPLKISHKYFQPLPQFDWRANNILFDFVFKNTEFEDIVAYELMEACKLHIAEEHAKDSYVCEENYFITLPKNPSELLTLFLNVFNWVKIDVVNYLAKYTRDNLEDVKKVLESELYQTMIESSKEKDLEIERLNIEIEKLKIENKKPNIPDDKEENIRLKSENEELKENLRILERQKEKLKKQYQELLEKYTVYTEEGLKHQQEERLTVQPGEVRFLSKDEIKKFAQFTQKVDFSAKYLFVLGDDSTFKGTISKKFPNAEFIGNNISSLNLTSFDMVIVITSHIGHSAYYSIKDMCKTQKIPLVHSKFTNVDIIEQLILENINRIK